jgi:aminoglycoside phosphotransferase family enzyme
MQIVFFLENNDALFYVLWTYEESKIRDIHGDLYLKNIFVIDNKFYLYDRIEFNNSLRYADLVEGVAHQAMDLDFHERSDLSNHFILSYI